MSLFKKKTQQSQKTQDVKVKECQEENGDSCPMCHIPQDVVDQLKQDGNTKKDEKEGGSCCK